jgi:predicted glycosyltransferase
MLYSQDGFGLGHLRRTSLIAAAITQACSSAAVLTALDSRLGAFFEPAPNQDYLKLPSVVKIAPGVWQAVGLPLDFPQVHAMRSELLRATARTYRPHLLLVDHMPHGAMGELVPTLEALRHDGGTKIVLGLRDIIDAPAVTRERWAREGAYQAIERYYDQVLVYGRRDVFDLAAQYGLPPSAAARVRYTGYVATPAKGQEATRLRARYAAGEGGGLIVAMAGGGADGYPLLRAVLDALPLVRALRPCTAVLVTGPFMPTGQRRRLQRRARAAGASVQVSVSDTLSHIRAADVVVAMAGYSTTIEVLSSRTPAILVPRRGPSAEQRTRAGLFASRGWVRALDPDDLGAETMAAALLASLAQGPVKGRPACDGLRVAIAHLLRLLGGDCAEAAAAASMLERERDDAAPLEPAPAPPANLLTPLELE